VVRVGGRAYGVPVDSVVEVVRMVALSPIPDGPPWMAGVADVRGMAVPVVDLAGRLGQVPRTPAVDRRIVITGDPAGPFGLIVDHVAGVAAAGPPSEPDAPGLRGADAPTTISPLVRQVVRIGEDMVMVLDETALRPDGRA
jgi:purine-binding chemotaxis protein CheW